MNWEKELQGMSNARVLDVATSAGGFLEHIGSYLPNPEKMIGIDTNQRAIDAATGRLGEKGYEFMCMSGTELGFEDASFDVVAMSNSLHHFSDPESILEEMKRVLKPDGILLIYEMVRDGVTPKQQSHVFLHDFWGKVDTQLGDLHNPTFMQKELSGMLEEMDEMEFLFSELEVIDEAEMPEENPEEMNQEIRGILDHYVERATSNNLDNLEDIKEEADAIMQYVEKEGFDSAPQYYYLLRKKNA